MQAFRTIFDLAPVLALFALGIGLRAAKVLDGGAVAGLRKLVVSLTLPALLFDAFFRLRPDLRNLFLIIAVFISCVLMIYIGRATSRVLRLQSPYAPLMHEGFEAGMLGYALFLGIAGDAKLPFFAACDLGQVLFVFSVLQAQLRRKGRVASESSGAASSRGMALDLLRGFATSPVVIAIAVGLVLGTLLRAFSDGGSILASDFVGAAAAGGGGSGTVGGLGGAGSGDIASMLFASFWHLVALVKALTMPLICFVIGADIELDRDNLAFALRLTLGRMLVLVALAFVVGDLFAMRLLGLPSIYRFAIFVLFLLPPPFVISVFMPADDPKENRRVATTLSLHSLASILAVGVAAVVMAPG
ncbi:MAG: hypothetical protein M0001_16255 [Treponema sp.]|nr:hypothetical protein [Treponema sp.]